MSLADETDTQTAEATGETDGPFPLKSPASGKVLAAIEVTEDVAAVVKVAREAQTKWAAIPAERRARVLGKLRKSILARAEEIGKLIHDETGKPEAEALLGEVLASADVVSYWAELAPEELEPMEAELDALSYPKKRAMVHRAPRGVIAIVMPWNFPFALPLRTIVPALLAGNSVVLKPSEITPRTGKLIAELVADALKGVVPDGVVSVVQGGGDVGGALIEADVDFVVFTGSTATGKKVAHACAERLLPCVVELGGKDAAIVLKDADLERAANGILWGAMMNAGQNCGAVERVYAEKEIADALAKKIAEAAKALRFKEDVGPLTTSAQRRIVERHVAAAREAGATILAGGEGIESQGFQPTVVTIDADDNPLIADETFGPVVPVTAVADVEEAITRANASRYGLTASLWTKDVRAAEKLAHRLKAGVITINNHSFTGAIPSLPWGGVGESGWGFTGTPLALDHLTRPVAIVVDRNRAAREMWWYPYTPTLRALALAFAALRGGAKGIGGRIGAVFQLLSLLPKRMGELKSGKPRA